MASRFVPLLNNIKDKNVAFVMSKVSKINTSGPNSEDFENVERKKTRSELMMLSLVVFGIEICYAAETAYVSPILQKIGVPIQFMSMVWGLSPLIGLFAGPLLGSLSDECRSSLGRRRPFIIMHSIGIIIGLLLTGYGHLIGDFFHHTQEYEINSLVILVTILGVILLDFDCDACQSPARAYLIDVSRVEDHSLGLSMFTVMAGAGGCIGYTLAGIPWARLLFTESHTIGPLIPIAPTKTHPFTTKTTTTSWWTNSTSNSTEDYYMTTNITTTRLITTTLAHTTTNDGGDLAYGHKQILFTMVAVIYVFCAVFSITSFKEIPLDMLDKPMNVRMKTVQQSESGSNMKYKRMEEDDVFDWEKRITGDDIDAISIDRIEFRDMEREKMGAMDSINGTIRAIIEMPNSLRWLCITHCLCWMSLLCFSLYFTDFVGEEVFGGIPSGEESNISLNRLYDSGVRFGSICMALYSFSCSVYSFFLKHTMSHFKTANVYRFSQIIYSIGMLVLAVTKSQMVVPLTSITAGIIYSSLFTIPFILVASYHNQESFGLIDSQEQERGKRGLGMDLSIVSSMVFVAQIILSFIIGPLMKLIHSKTVVIFTASFLSFMAFLTSNKLLYLD